MTGKAADSAGQLAQQFDQRKSTPQFVHGINVFLTTPLLGSGGHAPRMTPRKLNHGTEVAGLAPHDRAAPALDNVIGTSCRSL